MSKFKVGDKVKFNEAGIRYRRDGGFSVELDNKIFEICNAYGENDTFAEISFQGTQAGTFPTDMLEFVEETGQITEKQLKELSCLENLINMTKSVPSIPVKTDIELRCNSWERAFELLHILFYNDFYCIAKKDLKTEEIIVKGRRL